MSTGLDGCTVRELDLARRDELRSCHHRLSTRAVVNPRMNRCTAPGTLRGKSEEPCAGSGQLSPGREARYIRSQGQFEPKTTLFVRQKYPVPH